MDLPSDSNSSTLSTKERTAIRLIPFIVGCALFMQMLDATVVATALPAMAIALETTPVRMNVTITSYLLALAVFVPISGWAADRFGAQRVFIAAISLFSLSSVACALSQSLAQLVAARLVQGMAGAMMVPVGRIILLRKTPKTELLRAMAFLSMPALLGPVIGPPLGGFLVTYASWHWIFLINVPVGLIGIYLIVRFIPKDTPENPPRLDWLGFLLSGASLATFVWGFESIGNQEGYFGLTLLLITSGIVSGALYLVHAKRVPQPIVDLSLLRVPTFAISVLGGNLCRFSAGAMPFLLALLLQIDFGYSPFVAGLITFTSAAGALTMKVVATRIVGFFGFKRVLTFNALLAGGFIAICGLFQINTPIWLIITILATGGIVRSLQFTAVNTLTYADLGSEAMSRASTFASMAQQLAISLGVGTAALVVNLSMAWRGAETVARADVFWAFLAIGGLTAASTFSFARLPSEVAAHLRKNAASG
ncbi:MAG TPA: DHA2 family efflux MFS transporter permease subunit [Burkholderiaceae bacterium]|nr:DHA2 family efflux MFS transporter permease subunit [Burkholderiaceae bacterium]